MAGDVCGRVRLRLVDPPATDGPAPARIVPPDKSVESRGPPLLGCRHGIPCIQLLHRRRTTPAPRRSGGPRSSRTSPCPEDDDQGPGDEECGLVGPDDRYLLFLKVPEAKTVKNRMHICLRPTDRTRDEEVDRILGLGATLFDDRRNGDKGWAVLADPEGNEFCVLTPYRPAEA